MGLCHGVELCITLVGELATRNHRCVYHDIVLGGIS